MMPLLQPYTQVGGPHHHVLPQVPQLPHPAGFPPRHLRLKVGMPVMLLYNNIRAQRGVLDGTRLMITAVGEYSAQTVVISRKAASLEHTFPRWPLISDQYGESPVRFTRKQFLIAPAFSIMTIVAGSNPSPRRYIHLLLTSVTFTHGQLYVALFTCISSRQGLTVAVRAVVIITRNAVFRMVIENVEGELNMPGPHDTDVLPGRTMLIRSQTIQSLTRWLADSTLPKRTSWTK